MTIDQPYSMYTPPTPPRRRRTWWIWLLAVGVVVLVGGLVAAGVAEFSTLAHHGSSASAIDTGAPGTPEAADPLACPSSCFTAAVNRELVPGYPVLTALGLDEDVYPPGTYDPVTAGQVYRSNLASWRAADGAPDECFFAPINSPVGSSISDGQTENADVVTFVGTWGNASQRSFVDVSSRLFPDTESASGYLRELATNIQKCQEVEIGPDNHRRVLTVQPAAAITVPSSEAAVGWVRLGATANDGRAYVIDLQRGNLVVRLRVVTDGAISEAKFRSFATTFAQTQLGQLAIG